MKKIIFVLFLFLPLQGALGMRQPVTSLTEKENSRLQKILSKAYESEKFLKTDEKDLKEFADKGYSEVCLLYGEYLFHHPETLKKLTTAVEYVFKAANLQNADALHLVESITGESYKPKNKEIFKKKWPAYFSETLKLILEDQTAPVSDVALFFLKLNRQEDENAVNMTHFKLEKTLYYAQACSIQFRQKLLFPEEIQAWDHGPVVPEIYHEYKKFEKSPIVLTEQQYKKANLLSFSPEDKDFMTQICGAIVKHDESYLWKMTHSPLGPWESVYQKDQNNPIDLYFLKFDKTAILNEVKTLLDSLNKPESKKIKSGEGDVSEFLP